MGTVSEKMKERKDENFTLFQKFKQVLVPQVVFETARKQLEKLNATKYPNGNSKLYSKKVFGGLRVGCHINWLLKRL